MTCGRGGLTTLITTWAYSSLCITGYPIDYYYYYSYHKLSLSIYIYTIGLSYISQFMAENYLLAITKLFIILTLSIIYQIVCLGELCYNF